MRFRRRRSDLESQRTFRYPLAAPIKVAVFSDRLKVSREYLHFPENARPNLQELQVATIAAPASVIPALIAHWRATHPIVVFTGPEQGVLTAEARETLWRHSEVPVFEQLLGSDGTVIARECEAHNGLHLYPADFHPGGVHLRTVSGLCGCGVSGVRVVEWSRAPESAHLDPAAVPVI
jgi:hypothetical protein